MTTTPRHIAHLDLDCFFVSVERISNPGLIGKPVVVGGSPQGRGVVASASYEARAFGVRSAMPTSRARQLCPELIIVRGRHGAYGEVSDRVYQRMMQIAPVVERASIDELYMDFTGCDRLYGGDIPGFMRTVQGIVKEEFQLPCSVALATSKSVAKIAVNTVKPEGLCIVPAGGEEVFLAPLPIGVVPGVGTKTEEMLRSRGFTTVADVQRVSLDDLTLMMGAHGPWLYSVVHGLGDDIVRAERTRKSISREETFGSDLRRKEDLEQALHPLVEDVCGTLRAKAWHARTIQLKLRYSDFTTLTRSRSIEPTNDDPTVFAVTQDLLSATWESGRPVRLLGVHLSNFTEGSQLDLFSSKTLEKREDVLKAVDRLRDRFGDAIIHVGHA